MARMPGIAVDAGASEPAFPRRSVGTMCVGAWEQEGMGRGVERVGLVAAWLYKPLIIFKYV